MPGGSFSYKTRVYSFNGKTSVSKTAVRGSNPRGPAFEFGEKGVFYDIIIEWKKYLK
jgi:hypothetical protein